MGFLAGGFVALSRPVLAFLAHWPCVLTPPAGAVPRRPEYYDELTIEQKAALERPNHHSRRPQRRRIAYLADASSLLYLPLAEASPRATAYALLVDRSSRTKPRPSPRPSSGLR